MQVQVLARKYQRLEQFAYGHHTIILISLFQKLWMRVMNVDVDKTVIRTAIRNQIHIKGDNTPETKQQGGKRNAYHNTTTLSVY